MNNEDIGDVIRQFYESTASEMKSRLDRESERMTSNDVVQANTGSTRAALLACFLIAFFVAVVFDAAMGISTTGTTRFDILQSKSKPRSSAGTSDLSLVAFFFVGLDSSFE